MSDCIEIQSELYALHTAHTSYLFRILPTGQAEHLYYGPRLPVTPGLAAAIAPKTPCGPGCSIAYSEAAPNLCLDRLCGEISGEGKGDFGEPFVRLRWASGVRTTDFVFDRAEKPEAPLPGPLPSACGADDSLLLVFRDADVPELVLEVRYDVFADTDVIARSARLCNNAPQTVTVEKLASAQLDFADSRYVFTCFKGAWADEMHRCDTLLGGASAVAESRCGDSSNLCNPFTMLARPGATEAAGEVYGMNLLYSGGHRTAAQPGAGGRLRWQTGIQPEGFAFSLAPGESFAAPQAVFSRSDAGYGGLSRQLHAFVRRHIVRGTWRDKPRPVLLNSWEACYFKFDEGSLLKLAKAGADCGVELFVLDDGWFGKRDDDHSSLGDWTVNTKKLPHGLTGLAEKISAMGMAFGLWVEPEMVNPDSDLYRAHPDWAVASPGSEPCLSRNQYVLDLCRPEVRAYIVENVNRTLHSANIKYLKWDMNRPFTDQYSAALPADGQGRFAHAWMLGLYEVLDAVVQANPEVLFEGCASGGNRFDLGILCYMPQIWASDDTDAYERQAIQAGTSYGYPQSTMGCHVSAVPNHQTARVSPIDSRFDVAAFGCLGYELDFTQLTPAEKKSVRAQIDYYKQHRMLFQYGTFLRLANPVCDGRCAWMVVSPDKKQAAAGEFLHLLTPNSQTPPLRLAGLLPDVCYTLTVRPQALNIKALGSMLNQVLPVHVNTDGVLVHKAAELYMMPCESEQYTVFGDLLMSAGFKQKQRFTGTGYNSDVRAMPDFSARLYTLTACTPAPAAAADGAADTAKAVPAAAAVSGAPAAETAAAAEANGTAAPAEEPSAAAEAAAAPAAE